MGVQRDRASRWARGRARALGGVGLTALFLGAAVVGLGAGCSNAPPREVCDGLDNDGDGLTDEAQDLRDQPTWGDQGVCATAVPVCAGIEEWKLPATFEAEESDCDGLDNDCDGVTDEGCPPPCTPACTNRACGPDGCGGTCGACADHERCDEDTGQCLCIPACDGRECGPDGCGGVCGYCPPLGVCDDETGRCQCTPACDGRECGPDGCGGTCGSCSAPDVCDDGTGLCVCVPACEGKECGPDGCGHSCGSCLDGYACDTKTSHCECETLCDGRECGPDGCGGSCGTCDEGYVCDIVPGLCVCVPECEGKACGWDGCGGSCGTCVPGTVCDQGTGQCACEPSCDGKKCGADGCGGSCGACDAGMACDEAAGQCVCIPACEDKACGPDGCGGSCGTCEEGAMCDETVGVCVWLPKPGFVYIPPGTFTMGSPVGEPGRDLDEVQHEVTLTHGFYMQATELTQQQWQGVMGTTPSWFASCGVDCPVERVNWWDALAYANALSESEGLAPCYSLSGCTGTPGVDLDCTGVTVQTSGHNPYACEGYRLPTEAEWEYAYRAGTTTAFYNGPIQDIACDDPNASAIGWYCAKFGETTHPVGQKLPNGWGLYDMAGNVWEWCWDWSHAYPDAPSSTDPIAAGPGMFRVVRGGGREAQALDLRAAARFNHAPENRNYNLGFRVVRSAF